MTAHVSQAIQGAGAGILDSRSFSNLTLFIRGEVTRVAALRDALIATGLNVSTRSLESLDQQAAATDQPVIPLHLVVTFIHSEPDLRQNIHMRTNIVIDDKLMRDTLRIAGLRTKREAVEAGLRTLLRLGKQAELRRLRGKLDWKGDLHALRSGD